MPRARTCSAPREEQPRGAAVDLCAPGEAVDFHPLLGRVRAGPARAEDDRRDPGSREQRSVGPERDALGCLRAGRLRYCLDELVARVRLERRPAENKPRGRVGAGGERRHLAGDLLVALAGERSSLALKEAALWVARELLPAADQRRVDGRRPEERMRFARQEIHGELPETGEDDARRSDRVDAEIGPRAVRGAAVHLDLEACEATVRDAEAFVRRLTDDRIVRQGRMLDEPLGTE